MSAVPALAEETTSIRLAGRAEKATAAKAEASESYSLPSVGWHKLEILLQEGEHEVNALVQEPG